MLTPRTSRVLQALTLAAFVGGVTFSYLRFDFMLFFPLGAAFGLTVLVALGLVLDAWVSRLRGLATPHLKSVWIPVAFLLVAGVSPGFRAPFLRLGAGLRFAKHQAEYEAAVARAKSSGQGDASMYLWEDSPRPLYAFVWDGMADNWCGIVHDEAEEFATAPRDVFGGSLIGRVHLWGPWYYVEFT